MTSNIKWIAGIVSGGIVAAGFVIWLVYFNTPALTTTETSTPFAQGENRTSTTATPSDTNTGTPVGQQAAYGAEKIFKIADGPVAGATLIQITRPATSTIARFVVQTNGHTFDLVLDSPGAVPKAVSNTTIPGILKVVWTGSTGSPQGGRKNALMQYLDANSIKTVHFL